VDADTNPFRYGALALDDAFTDRESEVAELRADIRNGQDVVILAPRRYGKSSLMWRVAQELVRRRVLVASVDLMTTPTLGKLAEKLAGAIHEDVASRKEKALERVRVFGGLRIRPTVNVDPDSGRLSFGFDAGYRAEDLRATLEHLLELPGRLGAERNRRVALIFDEFQEVVDIDPALPRLMRAVFQEQPEVAHVYLGSRRHMMRRLFSDENEPFWRSAKPIELGVIAPEAFAGYIAQRFAATDRAVDPAVVDAVLATTGGHPYATQELCYFLWQLTPRAATAQLDTLDAALGGVLRSENAHFTTVWDHASAQQRLLLQALATEPGRALTNDYRRRHELPSTSTVQSAITALERQELVANRRGEVRIVEPFLAEWIRLRTDARGPEAG
jgi:AAA+ ATPase superfamily predicted ATPase